MRARRELAKTYNGGPAPADPTGPAEQPDYRQKQVYKPGESVPVVLDGKETLEVNALLP